MGALARGPDVFDEIQKINFAPDSLSRLDGLRFGQRGITVEVRGSVPENGFAQAQKSLDVPALDSASICIEIYGKVEKVRHKHFRRAAVPIGRLKDVQSLED